MNTVDIAPPASRAYSMACAIILLTVLATAHAHAQAQSTLVSIKEDPEYTLVNIRVPDIDGLEMDLWCYENPPWGRALKHERNGNDLVLFHEKDNAAITTRFVPHSDRVVIEVTVEGPSSEVVRDVASLNPCWQFRPAAAFANQGDYVEDFVARCFVYLDRGFTRLGDTQRIPGTRDRPNDKSNLPKPWIQEYFPAWRQHPGQTPGQRGRSPDRPVYPITGVISRDGRFLAAMAWPETASIGQVWHDCLHLRPRIGESFDARTGHIRSQGVVYFLANDPDALLAQFREDFPDWRQPEIGQP